MFHDVNSAVGVSGRKAEGVFHDVNTAVGVSGRKAEEGCFGPAECADYMQCMTQPEDGRQKCRCDPTYVPRLEGSCGE